MSIAAIPIAAEAGEKATNAVVKAVTTPIVSRKRVRVYKDDNDDDVVQTTEVNITPAAVGAGALAMWLVGLRLKPAVRKTADGKEHATVTLGVRPPFGKETVSGTPGIEVLTGPGLILRLLGLG